MEVSGQLHVPSALHPGKEPQVPNGWEAGWVLEPVRTQWRRKQIPLTPLPEIKPR